MAETFDEYEKLRNRTKPTSWMTVEDKAEAAMDMTELLMAVRSRVQTFLDLYEKQNSKLLEEASALRAEAPGMRSAAIAGAMENDYQELATVTGYPRVKNPEERLLLDDLKVLLDQFPQKNI